MKWPMFWKAGWPLIDRGDPCTWPFYKARIEFAKKGQLHYRLAWFDWR